MYIVDANPKFWQPVKARKPGQDGELETFRAQFRALTTDEFTAYDLSKPEDARRFLVDTLIDVREIEDERGAANYSHALRDILVSTVHVRQALIRAYLEGFTEALAGN